MHLCLFVGVINMCEYCTGYRLFSEVYNASVLLNKLSSKHKIIYQQTDLRLYSKLNYRNATIFRK